ncbi:MAG: hypothetical protein KCCBMMGE_00932 [Candidatus Methanoperedenaceae archaeon GB37]|nr:MAG: hypothetical protein KCCBMMGE_00932 [Candidatus Methanoperedenaceae archaeon GB37]
MTSTSRGQKVHGEIYYFSFFSISRRAKGR